MVKSLSDYDDNSKICLSDAHTTKQETQEHVFKTQSGKKEACTDHSKAPKSSATCGGSIRSALSDHRCTSRDPDGETQAYYTKGREALCIGSSHKARKLYLKYPQCVDCTDAEHICETRQSNR